MVAMIFSIKVTGLGKPILNVGNTVQWAGVPDLMSREKKLITRNCLALLPAHGHGMTSFFYTRATLLPTPQQNVPLNSSPK